VLSYGKHFFLIFTDYFFGVMDYFSACSDVCVKRTSCRPSTDNKGDAYVHHFDPLNPPQGFHLSAHLRPP
jgi:hypothetical protein